MVSWVILSIAASRGESTRPKSPVLGAGTRNFRVLLSVSGFIRLAFKFNLGTKGFMQLKWTSHYTLTLVVLVL